MSQHESLFLEQAFIFIEHHFMAIERVIPFLDERLGFKMLQINLHTNLCFCLYRLKCIFSL